MTTICNILSIVKNMCLYFPFLVDLAWQNCAFPSTTLNLLRVCLFGNCVLQPISNNRWIQNGEQSTRNCSNIFVWGNTFSISKSCQSDKGLRRTPTHSPHWNAGKVPSNWNRPLNLGWAEPMSHPKMQWVPTTSPEVVGILVRWIAV